MSAITNKYDDRCDTKGKGKCGCCGETLVHYPFLEWNDLRIRAKCCQEIKRGFIADLIQVAAIRDLFDLGYFEYTLIRKQAKEVEADWQTHVGG